ncbi:unnamed protein product [Polarella glacialis]|uniref:DNA (cytosine-5-)-methyltransferase n=1 Tax=Polarella glacialis TaxID=89957 RepID=A0A813DVC7_POLGL|nr:unnamed protein product [Polarella glacialis]
MPRLLELFSGAGSVGRSFRARGWEVTPVDLDPKSGASIITDVGTWNFDCVWASPPCTRYSCARTRGGPRDLEGSDRLVQRVLDIMGYHKPVCGYFIENSQAGLLKTRAVVQGLAYHDASYCEYSYLCKKGTRIWHDSFRFEPK